MSVLCARPSRGLRGQVSVPGDKSISHRALILGALAEGDTLIRGFLRAEDTLNTGRALGAMGVGLADHGTDLLVRGVGLRGLQAPHEPLDLGNSGTGLRLLMGVLAGQAFAATLTGDESLRRRPMDRVARPLGMMGIQVTGQGERCTPPVTVYGGTPTAIAYDSPLASAQVKSAVLLAGLYADGITTVREPARSRDHTERMLQGFGAGVRVDGLAVSVTGPAQLRGQTVAVPGDFSSAAFVLAAGLLCPNSVVTVTGVNLNPTRCALLAVLRRMGAPITVTNERTEAGEPVGDITIQGGPLAATVIEGDEIPALIDEVPVLAVIATQAEGTTQIRDAGELRVKESDRLAMMAGGLAQMGAQVQELPDGLVIQGPTSLAGGTVDARHDHRIAMSFAVAGLVSQEPVVISGAQSIETSFPGFGALMRGLGAHMEES